MTSPRRTIVVFGATGNQGGSVARTLIKDGNFDVVAITRDPTSSKAKDLAALGAKLVKGDLDDPSSYEPALKGVDGAFLVTDFWQHYNGTNANAAMAREVQQGKGAADALARAKVPHVVFSTLASYRPRQDLPHFDGKADITAYLAELNVPTTNLFLSYYFSNLFMLGGTEQPDGTLVLTNPLPDGVGIPSFAVEETGQWARAAFRDPAHWVGRSMDACTGYVTVEEYAAGVARATGRNVKTQKWTRGQFLADKDFDREWWLNWYAIVQGEMQYDVEASKRVVPTATGWTEWVQKEPKVKEMFGNK